MDEIQTQALEKLQTVYPFQDKHQEHLFNKISKELRCMVCQNQSLFDSMAPIAVDLRQEVYRQVRTGNSEAEIIAFVVNRYGDDILYNPPLQLGTSFLWVGPVLMLILGSGLLFKYLKISIRKKP